MEAISSIYFDLTDCNCKPLHVHISSGWAKAFPGAHIGLLLVEGVDNTPRPSALDEHKRDLVEALRQLYDGMQRPDLLRLPQLQAYRQYYKSFDKTYHVQLQLESVLFAGKSLPSVSPLVDACFAAELEGLLLTASHDVNRLETPVTIDVSTEADELTQLNGTIRTIRAGDMVMRDAGGVVCSVIYGQERDSAVSLATRDVLYVTYVPAGIAARDVAEHQEQILDNVRLFSPDAHLAYRIVYTAGIEISP